MSILLNSAAVGLAGLMMITSAMAGDRGDRRQQRQGERIGAGVSDGSLTEREAVRLGNQQLRIEGYEDHLGSDGDFSKKDTVKMEVAQDAAGRTIYRLRHNDRVRN